MASLPGVPVPCRRIWAGGQGVGTLLLKRLIDCARRRRMDEVWGDVREENSAMLSVCDELGFNRSHASDEPGVVHIRKRLRSV